MSHASHHPNIDVVVRYFYPVAAGIETNILETYSVLAQLGWNVTIHTSKDTYDGKNTLPNTETMRGLTIKRYEWHWWGCAPVIDWKSDTTVCLHNFDIFPQIQILIATALRKIVGRKHYTLFLTPHGGFNPEWSIFAPWAAFIKRTYHYTLGAWLINRAIDGVRAVSDWEKQEMITHGIKEKFVHVIANGVETEALQDVDAMASQDVKTLVEHISPYTLTISRVHPIKNYETTLRAFTKLPRELHHVIVGPVGDAEYKKSLEDMIVSLGLTGRVLFLGVVRGVDKYYLIKHGVAMVHMAKWESFCNAVHEGLSQGTPCIVADNTALSYLIKDDVNGFLVGTYDSVALADKIRWVYENPDSVHLATMKEKNKQLYRITWEDIAHRMHTLYHSLAPAGYTKSSTL